MTAFTAGTYSAKQGSIKKLWHTIDANGMVLGRLAAEVAKILRGKHKPQYTPHMDSGDNIVIVNARKIVLTGKKLEDKVHYWHTNHPGGIKERTMKKILTSRFPERVIVKAVERMMPKDSALARKQMKCLHVYPDAEHPHTGQNPMLLDLGVRNIKNKR